MSQAKKTDDDRKKSYPKADMVHRAVARAIDLVIAIVVVRLLPDVAGGIVAISYILLADAILKGQSPGKRLAGMKVLNRRTRKDALFKESIIRNLPFAIVGVFWFIPILGLILVPVGGLFVFAFEFYMAYTDRLGLRIGDVIADTQVVDASVPVDMPEAVEDRGEAKRAVESRREPSPEPEGVA